MLSLDAEKKDGGKVVHGQDARLPLISPLHIRHVLGFKVSSVVEYQPPDNGEQEPTDKEAGSENEQDVAPLEIQHCVEEVFE